MVMDLSGSISRTDSVDPGSTLQTPTISNYVSRLECYLYPYGAVSFRLSEEVAFDNGCSSEQIVDFLNKNIIWNGNSMTISYFFQQLRENLLRKVLKERLNFPYSRTEPQYYLVNPICEKTPDMHSSWRDIAVLLAMSGKDRYIANYDIRDWGINYGKPDQLILIGPRSCALFAPIDAFNSPAFGPGCLRGRLSNLSDLSLIQQGFINSLIDDYGTLFTKLNSMQGYPTAQLSQMIRDTFSYRIGDSIGFLGLLIQLQTPMITNTTKDKDVDRWYRWYSAFLSTRKTTFDSFGSVLGKLNTANIQLGGDVRNSVSGALSAITSLISSLKP